MTSPNEAEQMSEDDDSEKTPAVSKTIVKMNTSLAVALSRSSMNSYALWMDLQEENGVEVSFNSVLLVLACLYPRLEFWEILDNRVQSWYTFWLLDIKVGCSKCSKLAE